MASTLLASRNEPCWGERNMYMRNPSNPNPRPAPFSGFNAAGFSADRTANFRSIDYDDEMPRRAGAVAPSPLVVAASEDSSSLNQKAIGKKCYGNSGYVTFSVSNYSKAEQRELRRRLESELEQVRSFSSRIQAREFGFPARSAVPAVGSEKLSDRSLCRESKRLAVASPESEKLLGTMMKKCGQILSKLMKQKKSVWFNTPVDVVGMGLHDYFQIVKSPMDLGSAKLKLNKGLYPSPMEFAVDVRLTFNNALLYNPQGHEVHKLAGQYLHLFESLFEPAYAKYQQQLLSMKRGNQQVAASGTDGHSKHVKSSWPSTPLLDAAMRSEPPMQKAPTPPPEQKAVPSQPVASTQTKQSTMQTSKRQSQEQHQQNPLSDRVISGKQPKPRAKDLNKRPMSYEEKQKLGLELESLPHDKMAHVLQIVSRRNLNPMQNEDDEIELDIEVIDTETLWELDQYVNNCKKMMSKMRRKEEVGAYVPVVVGNSEPATVPSLANPIERSPLQVDTPENVSSKRSKKLDIAEEDVDIGDEMPPAHYPSLEIEKNVGDAGSSSSSGSDSSSSDDSDSGSSSGSDSDDARSPGVG